MEEAETVGASIAWNEGLFFAKPAEQQVTLLQRLCAPIWDETTGLPRPARAARLRIRIACAAAGPGDEAMFLPKHDVICARLLAAARKCADEHAIGVDLPVALPPRRIAVPAQRDDGARSTGRFARR